MSAGASRTVSNQDKFSKKLVENESKDMGSSFSSDLSKTVSQSSRGNEGDEDSVTNTSSSSHNMKQVKKKKMPQRTSESQESDSDSSVEEVKNMNSVKINGQPTDDIEMMEESDEHNDSGETDSDVERETIRSNLGSMSFQQLIELKERLGAKVYNEAMFGTSRNARKPKRNTKVDFKRDNKNRPREMSARKPVRFLGSAPNGPKTIRDPRFDENCGSVDSKAFHENYSFLSDIKEKELAQLKVQLKKAVDNNERNKIKDMIQRLSNQIREGKNRTQKLQLEKQEQNRIIQARKEGKIPNYVSQSERKAEEIVRKYNDLKASGKLDKHLEKRRKKNTARDRKRLKF